MFNGSLIDDLFAVVKRAEKSARPASSEVSQSGVTNSELLIDFDGRQDDRREANSEPE